MKVRQRASEKQHPARYALGVAVIGLMVCGSAHAATLRAEPGEWEMTATSHNPMSPTPQTVTRKQCIDRGDLDPNAVMGEAEGCSVSDVSASSNSMSWTMVCAAGGGKMTGKAKLQTSSGGKRVTGSMKMNLSAGGQTMNLSTEWSGRWLGPCP